MPRAPWARLGPHGNPFYMVPHNYYDPALHGAPVLREGETGGARVTRARNEPARLKKRRHERKPAINASKSRNFHPSASLLRVFSLRPAHSFSIHRTGASYLEQCRLRSIHPLRPQSAMFSPAFFPSVQRDTPFHRETVPVELRRVS